MIPTSSITSPSDIRRRLRKESIREPPKHKKLQEAILRSGEHGNHDEDEFETEGLGEDRFTARD
jgi:hypothetical protein